MRAATQVFVRDSLDGQRHIRIEKGNLLIYSKLRWRMHSTNNPFSRWMVHSRPQFIHFVCDFIHHSLLTTRRYPFHHSSIAIANKNIVGPQIS